MWISTNKLKGLLKLSEKTASEPLDQQSADAYKVLIYNDEILQVSRHTLQLPDLETGGSLFGYWTQSGSPVVVLATGPGKKSRHSRTSFFQDETYLYELGTKLYDLHGMQHIGEWHSHHQLGLHNPSSGDINTVVTGMEKMNWNRFLLLITTIEGESKDTVFTNFYLFTQESRQPVPLRINILPDESPIRSCHFTPEREENESLKQIHWEPGPNTPGIRKKVEEQFPNAWFTTPEARERLKKIIQDSQTANLDCKIKPVEDKQHLELLIGHHRLLLGPTFPNDPPQWLDQPEDVSPEEWKPTSSLIEWYQIAVKQAT